MPKINTKTTSVSKDDQILFIVPSNLFSGVNQYVVAHCPLVAK